MRLANLKSELSDRLKTTRKKIGRAISYAVLSGILAYNFGCATTRQPEIVLKEGMPNTLTYAENGYKKTVWDLTGCWEDKSGGIGRVKIKQQKAEIIAYKSDQNMDHFWISETYPKIFDGIILSTYRINGLIAAYGGRYPFTVDIGSKGDSFTGGVNIQARRYIIVKFDRCKT